VPHARRGRRQFLAGGLCPGKLDVGRDGAGGEVIESGASRSGRPFRRAGLGREVSIFAESRFGTRASGEWAAMASNGGAWDRYLRDGNRVRAVVRVDRRPGTAEVELPDGVDVVPLPYYVGVHGLVRALPALTVAVWRAVARAETIVVRAPGVLSSLAAIACRVLRRRYAVELIGDPVDVLRSGALGATGRRLAGPAGACLRWLVRGAAASVFVTRGVLQQRYPPRPGTPSAGIACICMEPEAFVSEGRRWAAGPFRVVTVGSQENWYKGHDVLLKALRVLVDSGIDVVATVVGGGRAHEAIVAMARSYGLADRVTFTGLVNDPDRIVRILDSAALFAFPSRTEGLPRALIEAMARGLPAVGSDIGGIPELLDSSYLVPVGEHEALAAVMAGLVADPAAWEAQSRRNLELSREYRTSVLDEQFAAWLDRMPPARCRAGSRSIV
jgi:glycosyltransferase involved in cell wall biosynthesis